MRTLKPALSFAGRFVLVYALLAAPWPGLGVASQGWPRFCGTALFGSFGTKGVVAFSAFPAAGADDFDTIIHIGNRAELDADQGGRFASVRINIRELAYLPAALGIALILATGISWRRRFVALAWLLVWMHVFMALLLAAILILTADANPSLGLSPSPGLVHGTARLLQEVFVTGISARRAVVVWIWVLVTIRREDWVRFSDLMRDRQSVASATTA
jgi:hypothetical protein